MKTPKFTDTARYPDGYKTAKESEAPGYLAKRFQEIRERQQEEHKHNRILRRIA